MTMQSWVEALAHDALAVIALGSCAAFGGIPAGHPNPTQCRGVGEVLQAKSINTPVVNIPGCPPHPDWFVGTVASILLSGLPKLEDLDEHGRPKVFYGQTIHENCPRRAYYDENKFAKKFGDTGCNYKLGCRGPAYISYELPQEAMGMGLVGAARSALGHWIDIKEGRIANYQVITPSTWNISLIDDREHIN